GWEAATWLWPGGIGGSCWHLERGAAEWHIERLLNSARFLLFWFAVVKQRRHQRLDTKPFGCFTVAGADCGSDSVIARPRFVHSFACHRVGLSGRIPELPQRFHISFRIFPRPLFCICWPCGDGLDVL